MIDFFKKKQSEKFCSPMEGIQMNIEDVPDPAFSDKCMGDGYAVEITSGPVVSPISGTVTACFPTGHAYGIRGDNGQELLIHIGIDTVNLNGEGFQVCVAQGDKVKQGDVLVNLDMEKLKASGKSLVSPVVFVNGKSITSLKTGQKVSIMEENVIKIQ